MRLAGYLRVSSEAQLDGFGLNVQESAIRSWAKANGHRVVQLCSDEGLSGALDAAERPGLGCALDALAAGTADGVIVARLDRLARQLTVQEAVLAECWKLEGKVFTADTGEVLKDEPDDPMRTAIRQMAGVFAQLDRAMVSKRLRDGRRAKAATGRKAVGDYPYGYHGAGKGRERDTAPDESEQRAVRLIVAMRREKPEPRPYREIAKALDAEGIKPRRATDKPWTPTSVRKIALREMSSG